MDSKAKRTLLVAVKWSLLGIELLFLGVLCLVVFLVPAPPYPRKTPHEIILALLSAATALLCGKIFVRDSGRANSSFANVLSTPPCVVCFVVLGAVVIPITIGIISMTRISTSH